MTSKRLKINPEKVLLIFEFNEEDLVRISVKESDFQRASPVFAEWLKDAAKEKRMKEFRLCGMDLHLVGIFQEFLGNKNFECPFLSAEDLFLLLAAAHNYQLRDLAELCTSRVYSLVSVGNVFTILRNIRYICPALREDCFYLIIRAAFAVFETDCEFGFLTEKEMEFILKSEDLNVLSEKQAFEVLLKWGSAQCSAKDTTPNKSNITKAIKNLVPCIRWPYLSSVAGLDEKWRIFALNQIKKTSALRNTVTSRHPRCSLSLVPFSENFELSDWEDYDPNFSKFRKGSLQASPVDLITFSLDFDAYLTGFEVFFLFPRSVTGKLPTVQVSVGTEMGGYSPLKLTGLTEPSDDTLMFTSLTRNSFRKCSFEALGPIRIPKDQVRSLSASVDVQNPKVFFPRPKNSYALYKGQAVTRNNAGRVITVRSNCVSGVKRIFFLSA